MCLITNKDYFNYNHSPTHSYQESFESMITYVCNKHEIVCRCAESSFVIVANPPYGCDDFRIGALHIDTCKETCL